MKNIIVGKNDLATTHPQIAKEAHGWDPTKVLAGSNKKFDWQCEKLHIYNASVNHRTALRNPTKCPYCTNQKPIVGENDLATTHPAIAAEAFEWDPKTVTSGSGKKKQWRCENQHVWTAIIGNRVRLDRKCPYCTNQKPIVGENDLATTHPAIAAEAFEWDPKTVTSGSGKKKQWRCENQHVWTADTRHRVRGNNCPYCSKYGFNNSDDGWIYFLIQDEWRMFQIGITNHPLTRIESHRKNGWAVLEIRGPMDGYSAREIENSIIKYLKKQGAVLSPSHIVGKFDGYTESWTIDSYKVNNLKELIDKASEAGF